jgi:hypothetical protein
MNNVECSHVMHNVECSHVIKSSHVMCNESAPML